MLAIIKLSRERELGRNFRGESNSASEPTSARDTHRVRLYIPLVVLRVEGRSCFELDAWNPQMWRPVTLREPKRANLDG